MGNLGRLPDLCSHRVLDNKNWVVSADFHIGRIYGSFGPAARPVQSSCFGQNKNWVLLADFHIDAGRENLTMAGPRD